MQRNGGLDVPVGKCMQPARDAALGMSPSLPYAGDLSPEESWKILNENPKAQLIDVRTQPEWMSVGMPDLASLPQTLLTISWRTYPQMEQNPAFVQELTAQLTFQQIEKDVPLLFLCKSGGRSADAAAEMTRHGWQACYNIEGGFEGEANQSVQRGMSTGWKAARLPWRQG